MMKLRHSLRQRASVLLAFTSLLGLFLFAALPAQAMNKAELVDAIASDAGLSKADAKRALEGFVAATGAALRRGDRVALVGFGSFSLARRMAPDSCEEVAEVEFSFNLTDATARVAAPVCDGRTQVDEDIAANMEAGIDFELAMKVIASIKRRIAEEVFENNTVANIRDFGRFSVVAETEITRRTGRNPQTGQEIRIRAKRVAKFKAGAALAGAVN